MLVCKMHALRLWSGATGTRLSTLVDWEMGQGKGEGERASGELMNGN